MTRRGTGELLTQVREFLLGRKINPQQRFQPDVAARTQPLPKLPLGPASYKLSNNYYYNRNPRSVVKQPTVIVDSSKNLLDPKKEDEKEKDTESKEKASSTPKASTTTTKLATPGKVYKG